MRDLKGREMYLSADASALTQELATVGAQFTCGNRNVEEQAAAMAENVLTARALRTPLYPAGNPRWVATTYLHGAPVQAWIDSHPEATDHESLAAGIYSVIYPNPDLISHHLRLPCPCLDILPTPYTTEGRAILAKIASYGSRVKFLPIEGGLLRWHLEVLPDGLALPSLKVTEV